MKARIFTLLSLTLLNSQTFANNDPINPDTARAYEGYLLTFIWPKGQSDEQIQYKEVISTKDLIRIKKPEDKTTSLSRNASIGQNALSINETKATTPFDKFEKQLDKHVEILSNQQWTLIFKTSGDTIHKTFYSKQERNGYPELIGDITIRLGRYLESDIHYQHYLFDRLTVPEANKIEVVDPQPSPASPFSFSEPIDEPAIIKTQPELKEFGPSFILKLEQSNKTASKKLNYLDHPTIGTLLYFEPIILEEAIEKIALQSMIPETGESLNYEDLQSTNELSDKEDSFEIEERFRSPVVSE